jgi:hypothetical protein
MHLQRVHNLSRTTVQSVFIYYVVIQAVGQFQQGTGPFERIYAAIDLCHAAGQPLIKNSMRGRLLFRAEPG